MDIETLIGKKKQMAKGAKKITKEGEGLPITPPKLSFIQKKLLAALYSFFETEPKDPLL